jgi:phage terminase large subunit GpA-like protein
MHKPSPTPGLRSAWRLDCDIFASAIRPDPDLTISEWADAHRILSPESSAEHGPWRTERVPYTREIMDALSPTDATTEVTFVAGTQWGRPRSATTSSATSSMSRPRRR